MYFNQYISKNERLARIISIQDVNTVQLSDAGSIDFESHKKIIQSNIKINHRRKSCL